MRCVCCNKNLSDWESTAKDEKGGFLDMCIKCIKESGVVAVGRKDLEPVSIEDEEDYDDGCDLPF